MASNAHVQIDSPHPEIGAPAVRLLIDGVDFTDRVFRDGLELVTVGDPGYDSIALRIPLAINQLDINGEHVPLTGHFEDAAARVAAAVADPDAGMEHTA